MSINVGFRSVNYYQGLNSGRLSVGLGWEPEELLLRSISFFLLLKWMVGGMKDII